MNDENPDLSPGMAGRLRNVPPADGATREAHLAAALDEMQGPSVVRGSVVRMDVRRRVLATAAAVLLVGLAYAAGWSTRGREPAPTAATVTGAHDSHDVTSTTSPVPKGVLPTAGPECADGTVPQMIDSVYVGEYANPSDGHTYLVYTFSGTVEFIDKDTCQSAPLMTGTTAP